MTLFRRGLVVLLLLSTSAQAAEMDVCRPYARKLTDSMIKYIWTWSYSHCLSLEEASPVPPSLSEALKMMAPDRPVVGNDTAAGIPPGEAPALGGPDAAPQTTLGKSGAPHGSTKWVVWCRKNFPRSWDVKTQTVILPTSRNRVRSPCPG